MKKKKNQTSVMNRYLLIGLSVFCIFMMLLSSFSDKVGGCLLYTSDAADE